MKRKVIFLLLICISIYFLKYKPPLIEPDCGMDIGCWINEAVNKVSDEITKIANEAMDAVMGPINDIIKQIKQITDMFKSVPDRFKNISSGLGDMGNGIPQAFDVLGRNLKSGFDGFDKTFIDSFAKLGTDFKDGGDMIKSGINDEIRVIDTEIGGLFSDIVEFIVSFKKVFQYIRDFFANFVKSYINCGVYKVTNLHRCFFYYMLEAIGQILYLPVRIFVYFVEYYTGCPIQPQVDMIWELVYCIDDNIKDFCGYSMIHYPQFVLDMCYLCDVAPMPNFPKQDFIDQCNKIHDRIVNLPAKISVPVDTELTPGFNKVINAIPDSINAFNSDMTIAVDKITNAFDKSNIVFKSAEIQAKDRIGSVFTMANNYDAASAKQRIDNLIAANTPT